VIKKGSKTRIVKFTDIVSIKQTKERRHSRVRSFRIIRIKVRNRRLPLIIMPYDYENKIELMEAIKELRNKFGSKGNV
jgi:translation initiation factor 1 (eIF-1/SUI1)